MTTLLAIITGSALINSLIYLVIVALIVYLVVWFIDYCGLPEPFNKVVRIVVMLIAVIFLINFLLSLAGHPLIQW